MLVIANENIPLNQITILGAKDYELQDIWNIYIYISMPQLHNLRSISPLVFALLLMQYHHEKGLGEWVQFSNQGTHYAVVKYC